MTPHQYHGRGSLVIDRRFKGVGRIRRATGTTDEKMCRRLNEMLTSLYEGGRRDVLTLIRDRRLTIMEVWEHYRLGRWDEIPTSEHLEPLERSFRNWIESLAPGDCSEKHRLSLGESCTRLVAASPKDARVVEVIEAVRNLRKTHQDRARTFNLARSAAQAFLRATVGRHSKLWQEVATIPPLRVVPKFHKHPQTVAGALEIREALIEKGNSTKAAAIWWALCTTGMRPAEFWGEWDLQRDRIVIVSAKRRQIVKRFVPKLVTIDEPELTQSGFDSALGRLPMKVTPYDGRRTYANWLEGAGVPRTRRKLYLGHGQTDVTDLYEWHDVRAFLEEDTAKLSQYITKQQPRRLEVVL